MGQLMTIVVLTALVTACGFRAKPHPSKRPPEPTLWKVCWDTDGDIVFPNGNRDRRCRGKKPREIRWAKLPIYVRVDASADHLENEVRVAFQTWNHWAGRTLFVESRIATDVAVVAAPPALCSPGTLAMAPPHMERGVRLAAGVFVCPLINARSPEGRAQTLVHEFGHVLGFAHDPRNRESIMYPFMRLGHIGRLSDADMSALHRVYGIRAR